MPPILSLCFLTFNCSALIQQLRAITSSTTFASSNDIELVIWDYGSNQSASPVADTFSTTFGERLRYFRGCGQLSEDLFKNAIKQCRGSFIKLVDDSMELLESGPNDLLKIIHVCEPTKPVIIFFNNTPPADEPISIFSGLDELLASHSYRVCPIGSFGIWRAHVDEMLATPEIGNPIFFHQKALFQMASEARQIVVSNIKFFNQINAGRSGGYSLAIEYGKNYLSLLSSFEGKIKKKTLEHEKKRVLIDHILPLYFNPDNDFAIYPLEEHLDQEFRGEPYYTEAISSARQRYEDTLRASHGISTPQTWRDRNQHNDTQMRGFFNIDRVSVGNATYGSLNIHYWGHPSERLIIGHYVSISEGVIFILGGNHPYKGFSTYPFNVKLLGHSREAQSKGPIVIKDDVWLGTNSMILSGVTIGQGAIVGAGSLVTKDVPPYAIVAGNPAKIVRFRFKPSIIEKLGAVDYSKLDPFALLKVQNLLYREVTDDNIEMLIKELTASHRRDA